MKRRVISLLLALVLVPAIAGAELSAWFVDVGQGDCTVIVCDGEAMIIDGGHGEMSRKVYSFIRETLGLKHVDYMISTHPHEDHLGGLAAVLNAVPVDLLLTPVTEWPIGRFAQVMRYAARGGTPVDVPQAGDRLALGGAVGMLAVLARQEILLLLVGGVFVMEAASVILQVASFKLTGNRIFLCAPIHHHFERKGWTETQIVVRFWILAGVFALLALATLKLR